MLVCLLVFFIDANLELGIGTAIFSGKLDSSECKLAR